MSQVKSFDVDIRAAFADGGSTGAAHEIMRACFGWDRPRTTSAAGLLAELQRPEVHAMVEWHQDVMFCPARRLVGDCLVIAEENQSNWQAAQWPDGTIEIGMARAGGWETWRSADLGGLLFRLLATEVVVGHGPCLSGSEVPRDALLEFELLPPLALPQGPAELVGVVATDRWFGVTTGTEGDRWVFASPVDRARHELIPIAADADWDEIPSRDVS